MPLLPYLSMLDDIRRIVADISNRMIAVGRRSDYIIRQQENIMAGLEELRSAVQAEKAVTAGVVLLLKDIHDRLEAALVAQDPAALQAVVDDLKANTASLSEAVAANTPGGPSVVPTDPVP